MTHQRQNSVLKKTLQKIFLRKFFFVLKGLKILSREWGTKIILIISEIREKDVKFLTIS